MRTIRIKLGTTMVALALLGLGDRQPAAARDEGVYALDQQQEATAEQMAADAIVVRPVGIVATVLGSVVYVVSMPFSYFGGNHQQAYEELVDDPAEHTFRRPLGRDF